jgi:hypothetical protein
MRYYSELSGWLTGEAGDFGSGREYAEVACNEISDPVILFWEKFRYQREEHGSSCIRIDGEGGKSLVFLFHKEPTEDMLNCLRERAKSFKLFPPNTDRTPRVLSIRTVAILSVSITTNTINLLREGS